MTEFRYKVIMPIETWRHRGGSMMLWIHKHLGIESYKLGFNEETVDILFAERSHVTMFWLGWRQ